MRGLKLQRAQQLCTGVQLIVSVGFHFGLIGDPPKKIKTLYLLSVNRSLYVNTKLLYKNVGRHFQSQPGTELPSHQVYLLIS